MSQGNAQNEPRHGRGSATADSATGVLPGATYSGGLSTRHTKTTPSVSTVIPGLDGQQTAEQRPGLCELETRHGVVDQTPHQTEQRDDTLLEY